MSGANFRVFLTQVMVLLLSVLPAVRSSGGDERKETAKRLDSQFRDGVAMVNSMGPNQINEKRATGFLLNDQTTVITNYHVISSSRAVFVRFRGESRPIVCQLIDADPSSPLNNPVFPPASAGQPTRHCGRQIGIGAR